MKTVNIIKMEKLFQEIQQVFDNRRKNIIQSFSWSLNIYKVQNQFTTKEFENL